MCGWHEERLIEDIFEKRHYQKLARPVREESEAVDVVFGLSLQQIIAVVSSSLLSLFIHLLFIYLFSPQKRGSMFLPALVCVSVCVCLSVTTITKKIVDGFVPKFTGRFLGEREDQVRVSLRSVEGCGSNGQEELYLPQNFAFAGSCTLSEYFLSSLLFICFCVCHLFCHFSKYDTPHYAL